MAILSDGELRARIQAGGLVEGGVLDRASECSYSFVSGAAFLPGSLEAAVEFPGVDGKAEVVVKPGQMIWIRTLERVKVPDSLVGFWWQTNSLSRRGLMLVNMSMVEPGYSGDLACLFVNFGKSNIPIRADTIIAKMVFSELEGELLHPFGAGVSREAYDSRLRELAIDQPTSFLQVGDLMVDLAQARTTALADVRASVAEGRSDFAHASGQMQADAARSLANSRADAEKAILDSKADASKDLATARTDALKGFREDIPKTIRGSFVWAASALVLLTLVSFTSDWVKGTLFPNTKAIAQAAADEAVRSRLAISATPAAADSAALQTRIDALNKRIDTLEHRK